MTSPPTTSANDGEVSAAKVRHRQELLAYEFRTHFTILWGSLVVLALSCLLSVRGEREVILPWVNIPLPGTCTTQRFLGIDCPGCGLTRAFVSLAHGDLSSAWRFNPVGILFFLLVVAQIPFQAWQLWRLKKGQGSYDMGVWAAVPLLSISGLLLLQWGWKLTSTWM